MGQLHEKMNTDTIDILLADFVSTSTEMQGAVLVSPQGRPLTHPIGISEATTDIMAGAMLHLAGCISEHCRWHEVDWVTIQAHEGYLILVQCNSDVFLLVRADVAPSGFLQHHIQQYLDQIRISLQTPDHNATVVQLSYRQTELVKKRTLIPVTNSATLAYAMPENGSSTANGNGSSAPYSPVNETGNGYLVEGPPQPSVPVAAPLPPMPSVVSKPSVPSMPSASSVPPTPLHLDEFEVAYCQRELAEIIGPMASLVCDRILSQTPHLRLMDFVRALSQHIPNEQEARNFQRRILSE